MTDPAATLRAFLEGQDVDADDLRESVAHLLKGFQVATRRWHRAMGALRGIGDAVRGIVEGGILDEWSDVDEAHVRLARADVANRVGLALAHAEAWVLRNTQAWEEDEDEAAEP